MRLVEKSWIGIKTQMKLGLINTASVLVDSSYFYYVL